MAHLQSLLDSPANLSNIKNRFGLRISEGNSTSIYSAQSKLRKFLDQQLQGKIQVNWDRMMLIDKVVDRCDNLDTIHCIYELYNNQGIDLFIQLASGKIRPFFRIANQYLA